MSKEIKPKNPENWLVDVRQQRPDGLYDESAFVRGITLANEGEEQYYEEVTNAWKEENQYHEPEQENEQNYML